jgi:D-alanyl-D-alanine carboxypeptidase/D-alanyl-D-alanine-endopeptidase (penicillin-binding protein 4)
MTDRIRWLLVLALSATATLAHGSETLDARVEAVLKTPGYERGHWGILVVDGKTGKTVYEHNADQLFCPASVTKLFSTAAAVADLGADYRFRTPVVRRGGVDAQGTLRGDLILVAAGDLSLGGRTGPDGKLLFEDNDHTYSGGNPNASLVPCDPLAGLDHLAAEVLAAGIKAVAGDIIVDDRLFEPAHSTGSGPTSVSPITINDNVVDVVATPGAKAGEPASVTFVPATEFVSAGALVETVAADKPVRLTVHSVGPRRFSVRGQIPVGHKPVVKIYEIDEPASFARALFIERLRAKGVRIEAPAGGDNDSDRLPSRSEVADLPKVGEYTSPQLREYIRVILKVSHNLHASTLPLLIAAHHDERTLSQGLKREGLLLKNFGIDPTTISFGGGAGGDRADLVTPRATVTLLRAIAARPDFPAFEAALPVLGRDGTLARAVGPDSPARGHARAKTGTYFVENHLNGKTILTSKALAGYLETASGRPLIIAFFVNSVPLDASGSSVSEATSAAGRVLGKLCEVFYASDSETKPAESDSSSSKAEGSR